MISFGIVTFQGYRQCRIGWPPVQLDAPELSNLWAADTFRGQYFMVVFGISGLLLFGLSFLAYKLF